MKLKVLFPLKVHYITIKVNLKTFNYLKYHNLWISNVNRLFHQNTQWHKNIFNYSLQLPKQVEKKFK